MSWSTMQGPAGRNNANHVRGILRHGHQRVPPWNGTRKAAAVMRERKRGAIVNLSSTCRQSRTLDRRTMRGLASSGSPNGYDRSDAAASLGCQRWLTSHLAGSVSFETLAEDRKQDLSPFTAIKDDIPRRQKLRHLTTWLLSSGRSSVPAHGSTSIRPGSMTSPAQLTTINGSTWTQSARRTGPSEGR